MNSSHNELLPVVNENDQVIGQQPRHVIHAQGLLHRAVHILVFNQGNELFLQKRSESKDINPGLWDSSAAGHVDPGESYLHCARREIKEELGVQADQSLSLVLKLPAIPKTGMEFVQVYRCYHDGPFDLAVDEIERGEWFMPDRVDQMVSNNDSSLTDTFKLLWPAFRKYAA